MKKFLVWVLLGSSIMVIGPKGMELGSQDKSGSYMTVGPEGMKLGNIDKQGNMFQLGPDEMSLGKVGDDYRCGVKSVMPKPLFPDNDD